MEGNTKKSHLPQNQPFFVSRGEDRKIEEENKENA